MQPKTQVKITSSPGPQKAPLCLFTVNNCPLPRSNQYFYFYHHTFVFLALKYHINGIEHMLSTVSVLIHYYVCEPHPCINNLFPMVLLIDIWLVSRFEQ